MKHTSLTAVLAAGAVCFAVQASASLDTNAWFSVDFASQLDSNWTKSDDDDSAIVSADIPSDNKGPTNTSVLKLETNGEELLYSPADYSGDYTKELLQMQVYLVASEEAPTVDNSAQTAVYLDSAASGTLKAKIGNGWETLSTGVNAGWHNITILMDYTDTQKVFFELDGNPVGNVNGYATGSSAEKVSGLGFKGSGYVDNFVGKAVNPAAEPLPPMYDDEGDGEAASTTVASTDTTAKTVTFNTTKGSDAIKFIRVYDTDGGYKTLRYTDDATVCYAGASKVVAYYGDDVSNVEAADEPVPVVAIAGTSASVSVANPKTGVYYGLYNVTSGDPVYVDSFLVDIDDDVSDAMGFDTAIPVSSADWGVVKFTVKASDDDPTPAN